MVVVRRNTSLCSLPPGGGCLSHTKGPDIWVVEALTAPGRRPVTPSRCFPLTTPAPLVSAAGTRIMKICARGPFLLLLLLLFLCSAVAVLGSVVVKRYEYVSGPFTWLEAQSHCRSEFTDLGTIFREADEETNLNSYTAWINLRKQQNEWVWFDGATSDDIEWAREEPQPSERCAVVSYGSEMIWGRSCDGYAFFFCSSGDTFVPHSMKMTEAEAYCRPQNNRLRSFRKGKKLGSDLKEQNYPVWTGLHREGGTWQWSYGLSEYRNWASTEPSARGDCVAISSRDKKMSAQNCSARFPSICVSTNLVLVKEKKTWEEALAHCRGLGSPACDGAPYDLVSVERGDEDVTFMAQEADSEEVWLGLRFLAGSWLWVNGATLLYPDLPACPPPRQRCGALPKSSNDFVLLDCSERRNFLCYRQRPAGGSHDPC
ncbi:putative C-type lectin domain family 20 member A [Spinachia spinachia]